MTTDTKADTKKGPEGTPTVAVSPQALITTPMILKRGKLTTKGSKKKYSSGTKAFQRLTLGISKAAFRTSNSVAEGLKTFSKDSSKSARKRRDGMFRDSLRNASRGLSDGLVEFSKAPAEITDRVGTGRVWRTVRVFVPFGN
jgi:hypothetical protein